MKAEVTTESMDYGIAHHASYMQNGEKIFTINLDIVTNFRYLNNDILKKAIELVENNNDSQVCGFDIMPSHGTVHFKNLEVHKKSEFSVEKLNKLIATFIYFSTVAGVIADLNDFKDNKEVLEVLGFVPVLEEVCHDYIRDNIVIVSSEWFSIYDEY